MNKLKISRRLSCILELFPPFYMKVLDILIIIVTCYTCVEQQLLYQNFFSWHLFKMRSKMTYFLYQGKWMGFAANFEGQYIAILAFSQHFLCRGLIVLLSRLQSCESLELICFFCLFFF